MNHEVLDKFNTLCQLREAVEVVEHRVDRESLEIEIAELSDELMQWARVAPAGDALDMVCAEWLGGRVGERVPHGHTNPKKVWLHGTGGFIWHRHGPPRPQSYSTCSKAGMKLLEAICDASTIRLIPDKRQPNKRAIQMWLYSGCEEVRATTIPHACARAAATLRAAGIEYPQQKADNE